MPQFAEPQMSLYYQLHYTAYNETIKASNRLTFTFLLPSFFFLAWRYRKQCQSLAISHYFEEIRDGDGEWRLPWLPEQRGQTTRHVW